MPADPARPPAARWTVAQSVQALHRDVLRPAGYRRQRSQCIREDFARRSIVFEAARWRTVEERSLDVSFVLGWVLPPEAPRDASERLVVAGGLRESFLLPTTDEECPPGALVEAVAGPVLGYLEQPTSTEQMVDALLTGELNGPRSANPPGCNIIRPPGEPYLMAAWGALLLADDERCKRAIDLANAEVPPGTYSPDYQALRIRELEDFWTRHYGRPLSSRREGRRSAR